jgi:hypothetical protein
MTLPFSHYETVPDAGSVNIVDEDRAAELWKAMAQDKIGAYLKKYPEDELPPPRQVS